MARWVVNVVCALCTTRLLALRVKLRHDVQPENPHATLYPLHKDECIGNLTQKKDDQRSLGSLHGLMLRVRFPWVCS